MARPFLKQAVNKWILVVQMYLAEALSTNSILFTITGDRVFDDLCRNGVALSL